MTAKNYLAFDLGASSGRAILGRFDGKKLSIEELHRHPNGYVRMGNGYYWDIISLFSNIKEGIARSSRKGYELSGIGIDTWAVDFGLIDKQGKLISNPRAYRDPAWLPNMKAFHKKYGERTLFNMTGIANLEFNTVYQLYSLVWGGDPLLGIAEKLLLLPDLLGYLLCGEMSAEYSNATATQMLDRTTGNWSKGILDMTGVPESLMPDIRMGGTIKGVLYDYIKEETGQKGFCPVFNVGSHDTASAVASVPAEDDNYAYISSGTWSLMGIVSDEAIVNDFVYENDFSNEGTVDGKYRPLKNIMGLWIIQCCKKQWDRESAMGWDEISALAEKAPAFRSFIDVNDRLFFDGDNMVRKIQRFCEETGQPVPQSTGEIARTVYQSLAMSYRETFQGLESLKGKRIDTLHIVGGGAQNSLLNRFTADATNRTVLAGPYEATAAGNLVMQLIAAGELGDIGDGRQLIGDSFEVARYEPEDADTWAEEYERYLEIKKKNRK